MKKIYISVKLATNSTHFNKVEVPYAFKLLMQELITMNIAPRIKC